MAGLDSSTQIPTEIKLHQASRLMELSFADGTRFRLPYEFLRVYSPSAEVRGHGVGQETLQVLGTAAGGRSGRIAELQHAARVGQGGFAVAVLGRKHCKGLPDTHYFRGWRIHS